MLAPFLTEYDPVTSSEGALDPLGLFSIADALAMQLAPGVRQRQSHPRFLTAMALSSYLSSYFDDDAVAADGVSEPWQVFEWMNVEGIVRCAKSREEYRGMPGSLKAQQAIDQRNHLSAPRYLKTPSVFGYHGVYRTLAREIDVIDSRNILGETGYTLLTTWESEQGLRGITGTQSGPGKNLREKLLRVIKDSMEKGRVAREAGWSGFEFFYRYLRHLSGGQKEAAIIRDALLDQSRTARRQTLLFLISDEGRRLWDVSSPSEFHFHEALERRSEAGLRNLLQVIIQYERFARYVTDAFDAALAYMTQKSGKTAAEELAALPQIKSAAASVTHLFQLLTERLEEYQQSLPFTQSFHELAGVHDAVEWARSLLKHHIKVQRAKPPNGKNPWFQEFDDGTWVIRAAYRRDQYPATQDELKYVHFYRTASLWSFAKDLLMI